jgi:hypothetical protein
MRLAFLRQSVRSNYCAPYTCAMLLAFYGYRFSRVEALRLFGLERRVAHWRGASHTDVLHAILRAAPDLHPHWQHHRRLGFEGFRDVMSNALLRSAVVLATAVGVYGRERYCAKHAFLVTGVARGRVQILDPLGKPPSSRQPSNAYISDQPNAFGLHRVRGSPWDIDLAGRVSLLVLSNPR